MTMMTFIMFRQAGSVRKDRRGFAGNKEKTNENYLLKKKRTQTQSSKNNVSCVSKTLRRNELVCGAKKSYSRKVAVARRNCDILTHYSKPPFFAQKIKMIES